MAYEAKTNWKLDDTVMPEDMNRIESGIQELDSTATTVFRANATIPITGWSSTAPYTIDIVVSGMLETDEGFAVNPIYASTLTTRQAQAEAFGNISMITSGTDKITVTCDEEIPTTAIPIQITVVR